MSFLFDSVSVPGWLLLLLIVASAPSFYKLYMKFHHKFVRTGKLKKHIEMVKDEAELKLEIMRKATSNQQQSSHQPSSFIDKKEEEKNKKAAGKAGHTVEKEILRVLATKGDRGMLLKSIADAVSVSTNDAKHSLDYLLEKNLIEMVNGVQGENYYLTERGKSYSAKMSSRSG